MSDHDDTANARKPMGSLEPIGRRQLIAGDVVVFKADLHPARVGPLTGYTITQTTKHFIVLDTGVMLRHHEAEKFLRLVER